MTYISININVYIFSIDFRENTFEVLMVLEVLVTPPASPVAMYKNHLLSHFKVLEVLEVLGAAHLICVQDYHAIPQ